MAEPTTSTPEGADSPHQAEDLVVHLAYFDPPSTLSFVWNGTQGSSIDVCLGGYAEPVIDQIQFDFNWNMGLGSAFAKFKEVCKEYAEAF